MQYRHYDIPGRSARLFEEDFRMTVQNVSEKCVIRMYVSGERTFAQSVNHVVGPDLFEAPTALYDWILGEFARVVCGPFLERTVRGFGIAVQGMPTWLVNAMLGRAPANPEEARRLARITWEVIRSRPGRGRGGRYHGQD
jgi:hypothetical protein